MSLAAYELSKAQVQALGISGGNLPLAQIIWAKPPETDQAGIHRALVAAYARYDILRTRFERPAGLSAPLQTVTETPAPDVTMYDSVETALPAERLRITADAPGVRAAVADRVLVLTAAAAIADEASLRLLADQLCGAAPDEEEPLQYLDYAGWEAEQFEGEAADARVAKRYWARTAAGAGDVAGLPARATVAVPMSAPSGFTAERWLAAWSEVLRRHAGPDPTAAQLAILADGRVDDDLRLAIGSYERYVPLVVTRDATTTLNELAGRVATDAVTACRFAVFAPAPAPRFGFSVRSSSSALPSTGAFDTELVVTGSSGVLWYVAEEVDPDHAARLAAEVETLINTAHRDPRTALADIDIRGAREVQHIASALTGRRADAADDDRSIAAVISGHVTARGDAPAVVHGDETLSWSEFGSRSDAIAAAIPPGQQAVGVLLDRSADQIAAAFGILRAGAAYVPLQATSPPGRLAEQLRLAKVGVVVASNDTADMLPDSVTTVRVGHRPDAPAPPLPTGGGRTAYLIFTSGSTGTPKPVAVTHANVLAYAAAAAERLGIDERTRFAAVTDLATDLGNTAIFGALLAGGTLEVVPNELLADGPALARLIRRHGVTALKTTPSHLRALLAAGDVSLELPLLVVGGEKLDADLVEAARTAGAQRVVNHYGPTEATIGVFTFEVPEPAPEIIPLGRPLAHVRALILDARGVPTPLGAVGRLAIAGPGVAAGYAGQPDLTAERFVPEPEHSGCRMYLTGDDVRLTAAGALEFLGRSDGQVKIRGFRVELGEIEARLRAIDGVEQSAAVATDDDVLSAFVVASRPVDADAIRRHLQAELPPYMVPQFVVQLDRLPLTASGKLDRAALAATALQPAPKGAITPPRTDTETALAEIWRSVLPASNFGVEDNFFQLGGHSLIATKVIARARQRFGVDLPLFVIFASSTIATMAAEIDARLAAAAGAPGEEEDLAQLLEELESLTDADAARLLAERDDD